MKIIFILSSYITIYLMYVKFRSTCDRENDTFRIEFLLLPAIILSLVVNHDTAPLEVSVTNCEYFKLDIILSLQITFMNRYLILSYVIL